MKHLGDITKIHGYDIEPVDCISFGSPCQDLSVAGNRAGLAGERSGLFMEAVRIIKEMREKTDGGYPTFAVWENVPGSLSSKKGEDFRAVLEVLAKIKCPWAVIPGPPKGKWRPAGSTLGDGWSLAWRVMDAQFWGVPQRRRRIALVVDFGGGRAPEILFERQSLRGNPAPGKWTWQAASGRFVPCADVPDGESGRGAGVDTEIVGEPTGFAQQSFGDYRAGVETATAQGGHRNTSETLIVAGFNGYKSVSGDIQYAQEFAPTLEANMPADVLCGGFSFGQSEKARSIGWQKEVSPTLRGGEGGNQKPCVCIQGNTIDRAAQQNGLGVQEELAYTLDAVDRHGVCAVFGKGTRPHSADEGQPWQPVAVANTLNAFDRGESRASEVVAMATGQANAEILMEQSPTLNCNHEQPAIAKAVDCRNLRVTDASATLQAKENGGQSLNYINPVLQLVGLVLWTVRRLTPTECERLQGYPDGWTNIGPWRDSKGKLHKESSDSARYRALGNSIALPQWAWLMGRMAQYLPAGAILGSLFDGIGGFPLVWERIHGAGTARWASEIDEFCMAVTKFHF